MSIISEYPFRFCILHIVKVTAGKHFSDRLLVLKSVILHDKKITKSFPVEIEGSEKFPMRKVNTIRNII